MSTATEIKYIVRDPNVYGGKPRIEGHRISVHDIALARYFHGYIPDQIVTEPFPTRTLAQVYTALLYYEEHKDARLTAQSPRKPPGLPPTLRQICRR